MRFRGTELKAGTYAGYVLLACAFFTAVSLMMAQLDFDGETLRTYLQVAIAVAVGTMLIAALSIRQVRHDRRHIADSEQRFRRAMYDSAIGVSIVGLNGSIIEANPAFAAMLGYTKSELETLTFYDITHPDDLGIGADTMESVRKGEISTYRFEKRYVRSDGSAVWALLSGSVISDDDGKPLYLVSQIEDIDMRKRAEARIVEAETRWNFALASAGQGVWDMDMRKGGTTYSTTWVKMLGYEPGELDGDPNRWLTMIHPDDRALVEEADRAHLEGKTPYFVAEFRMRHKDGRWIWILDRGKAIERDEQGNLIRAIGSLTDITSRKEAEERLADEKERLRVMLQSIGDAVIGTDAANHITFMNPIAEKLTGVPGAEALGKQLSQVYWAVDEETGHRLGIGRPAAGFERADQNSRAVLVRRDDTRCSIRQVVSPIVNERGEFCGSVIVFQDFTDARALQRQLAHAAAHDALTGLANRSHFIRTMEKLVDKARDSSAEHQFMYIDLDHFKMVNDTGGHAAGDALLRQVSQAIRSVVSARDTVARLGGDEFAVILESRSAGEAETAAKAIIEAIRSLGFTWDAKAHSVGASIGITPIRAGCGEVDEIIARADSACYASKAAGRNCISLAPVAAGEAQISPAQKPFAQAS